MRGRVIGVAAVAAVLAAPAAAQAATYTVDSSFASGCSGGNCKTMSDAVAAATNSGDAIDIHPGTYNEPALVLTTPNLVITGAALDKVKIVGTSTSDPVIKLSGPGQTLSKVAVQAPAGGAGVIEVTPSGAGATLDTVAVIRIGASTSSAPALNIAGGTSMLKSAIVAATGAAGTPAVLSSAPDGLTMQETLVSVTTGPGLRYTASQGNQLVRSVVFTTEASSNAVEVLSAAAGSSDPKRLVIDSSILVGGANAAGVLAKTFSATLGSDAGDIELVARHLTAAGAATGIVLAAEANGLSPPVGSGAKGNILATVSNSIVHGPSQANHFTGLLILQSPNVASLTFARSDAPPATGNGTIDMGGSTVTPDSQLFVSLNKLDPHLRADAPVIDKGTPPGGADSSEDIDGQPRVIDGNGDGIAASDLGADEFLNLGPTAVLSVSDARPHENVSVTFDGRRSGDPEAAVGGGLVKYEWDFGDGSKATTATAQTVKHRYTRRGTYTASLVVTDRQGGHSSPAKAAVEVIDGIPPKVTIVTPRAGQALRLSKARFSGLANDDSGVRRVEAALQLIRKASTGARAAATCLWFDGKSALRRRSCSSPLFFKLSVNDFNWSYRLPRAARSKLPAGVYELRARATDVLGNVSKVFTAAAKTKVRFRLKR